MRIVCLINGGDSLVAFHHTKSLYPDDEVIPIHFNLNLPYSKKLLEYMPDYVLRDSFRKYSEIMDVETNEDSILCDNPYEPLIWSAIVKHSADKVVLGLISGDFKSEEEGYDWLSGFNAKFAKDVIECPFLTKDKSHLIMLAGAYRCLTPVLATISCRSKEPLAYGCGNCYNCIRKRSAILKTGRITNIPVITKIHGRTKMIIDCRVSDLLSGSIQKSIETEFNEIIPSLLETFGTDDPFKVAKRMKGYL